MFLSNDSVDTKDFVLFYFGILVFAEDILKEVIGWEFFSGLT